MFTKILIANRGEIACRIIKTAKRLGINCVAIYSTADQNALHVKQADEAYCIGPAPSQQSYLNMDNIIQIALQTGAQAIHPGYGFLSEKAKFAEKCAHAKLTFIGPTAQAISAMGSKSAAKQIMEQAQVPLIPGYHGEKQDLATLQTAADKLGYPLLLKATAGGGGKGMRVVNKAAELPAAIAGAKREALNSFGDEQLLIEKYFINPRHVEIQIFADNYGNTVYLFERDCSIQRRHQKIIEEAPAPHLSAELRKAMGQAAIAAARAIEYTGAGTIEFLLANNQFYFMEMNTRLQVEHPITEMITGVDLVEWQLKIAAGETLPLQQEQLKIHGHAFEVRLYAEDPLKDFLPSVGKINYLKTPTESTQIRLDSGITQGDEVTPYYDPLLAKLIVCGQNRASALNQLTHALAQFQLVGIQTNLELLTQISKHPAFMTGEVHTGFIKQHQAAWLQQTEIGEPLLALATLFILLNQQVNVLKNNSSSDPYSPWHQIDNWRANLPAQQKIIFTYHARKLACLIECTKDSYLISIDNQSFIASGLLQKQTELRAKIDGQSYHANMVYHSPNLFILVNGQRFQLTHITTDTEEFEQNHPETNASLTAPMPGKLIVLTAKPGEQIKKGEPLAIVEAMKMEHTIHAPYTGIVKEWYFAVGDLVNEGKALLAFDEVKT